MQKRELVPYGYRLFTGKIMSDAAVDRYNYIQGRINASIDAGIEPSDSLLNESHQCIALAADEGVIIG